MAVALTHESLKAELTGVSLAGGKVWQFRGLQYGSIHARFALPQKAPQLSGNVDCTHFGPRCPQNYVDFRRLLRIPESIRIEEAEMDEVKCLNLDITLPAMDQKARSVVKYPVMIWVHGGSQIMTFGSVKSGLCDPTKLVAKSVADQEGIIVVNLNYRLNVFAAGDGKGEKNLALKDQSAAIEYIRNHIGGFGGDPGRLTIAGESAGAVFAHAQMVIGAPVKQCILQSGTLWLSPPQPEDNWRTIVSKLETNLAELGPWSLADAPVDRLLEVQAAMGLVSVFLQEEEALQGWETAHGSVNRLLLGDTEYESIILHNGIEKTSPSKLLEIFQSQGEVGSEVARTYGVEADRGRSSKIGALDFLHDQRFTAPVERMTDNWREAQRPVFRFLVDQPNPRQTSSRAHHAVDLLYLFEGFDLSFSSEAQNVSAEVQSRWITFINGNDPWPSSTAFAFGPLGRCEQVGAKELAGRRRVGHCQALSKHDEDILENIWRSLAAGRLGLDN